MAKNQTVKEPEVEEIEDEVDETEEIDDLDAQDVQDVEAELDAQNEADDSEETPSVPLPDSLKMIGSGSRQEISLTASVDILTDDGKLDRNGILRIGALFANPNIITLVADDVPVCDIINQKAHWVVKPAEGEQYTVAHSDTKNPASKKNPGSPRKPAVRADILKVVNEAARKMYPGLSSTAGGGGSSSKVKALEAEKNELVAQINELKAMLASFAAATGVTPDATPQAQ